MFNPFKRLLPQKFLGIDIGTSSIKTVEISKIAHRKKLENYGQLSISFSDHKAFRTFEKSTLVLSNEEVAKAIEIIVREAKMKTKKVIFSVPDFSSFFTSFQLPPMTKEELSQAVKYEARQHIPLPLEEVILDWQIMESRRIDKKKTIFKILLAAVPNEVIDQYEQIAKISNLELFALEAEIFSLIRALVKKDEKKPLAVIDIGAQSTTCSIVNKGDLKTSHSFDMSDNDLTSALAGSFNIDFSQALELKKEIGLQDKIYENGRNVKDVLAPLVDMIMSEINEIINNFYNQEKIKIEKIILAGGTALMPGLQRYFKEWFKGQEIEIGDPFYNINYPPILKQSLTEMGPSYSIAVGAALRGLQD